MGNIVCRRCPDCMLYHTLDIPFCECGADLRQISGEVVSDLILPMYYGDIDPALPVYQQQCPACGTIHYVLRPSDAVQVCPACGSSQAAAVYPSLFDPQAELPVPGQRSGAAVRPEPSAPPAPEPRDADAESGPDEGELTAFWLRLLRGEPAQLPGQPGPELSSSASPLAARFLQLERTPGLRDQPDIPPLLLKEGAVRLFTVSSAGGVSYRIRTFLPGFDGVSVYLLCTDPMGVETAIRVYNAPIGRSVTPADHCRLLDHMQTPQGQTGIRFVRDLGLIHLDRGSRYFEVLDHCPDGSLSRAPAMDFPELVSLAEQLNNALHGLHSAGLVHGNLCPSNIFRMGDRFLLGGFGTVCAPGEAGEPMDEVCCRSPESLMPVPGYRFTAQDDYYALGITLASLFDGRLIFGDLDQTAHRAAVQNESLPLRRSHPDKPLLLNLVRGLCQTDPEKRFGWNEVCMWLKNPHYSGGSTAVWPEGISILDTPCTDARSMFQAITADSRHWDAALEELYSCAFTELFLPFHQDLALAAKNTAQTWQDLHRDKGLSVFLKKLLPSGPLVWRGDRFETLAELASAMLDDSSDSGLSELLRQECVSHWLANTPDQKPESGVLELVDQIEDLAQRAPWLAHFWFANSFAPQKSLTLCGRRVTSLRELPKVMFRSPAAFYRQDGFRKLTDREAGADLYGFLYSHGFRRLIEDTWKDLSSCGPFEQCCALLSMLDRILQSGGADPSPLRQFFVRSGPVGAAVFARELALQEEPPVYTPIDSRGSMLLSRVREFTPPGSGAVEDLLTAYTPLLELVRELSQSMSANPFDTGSLLRDRYSIQCENLKGCFNYEFLGTAAPLGFSALLEQD